MSSCSEIELYSIIATPALIVSSLSKYSPNYFTDCLITVFSQYCIISFPRLIPYTTCILIFLSYINWRRSKKIQNLDTSIAFDMYRTSIMVPVTICILMADFSFWIPRFGKTHNFGLGLMDIGIGSFLFNSGLFSSKFTASRKRKNIFLLFLLGIIRLVTVQLFKLEVNPVEYGIHLNFYFILCAVNILFALFNSRFNLIVGIALMAIHEALVNKYSHIILSSDRSSLFLQNKEGIFSIIPSFSYFLIANQIGQHLVSRLPAKPKIYYSILYSKAILIVYLISLRYSNPSRRLSNIAFMSWSMFIQSSGLGMCIFIAKYFSDCIGNLYLTKFISKNMMVVFLFSNALVLIIKLITNITARSLACGHIINIAYLMLNFVVLPFIAKYLKLRIFKY